MTSQKNLTTGMTRNWMSTTEKNGTNYQAGNIVIANLKYSDGDEEKSRPALIVSVKSHNKHRQDLVLLKISSTPVKNNRWEVDITPSKLTGLTKLSKVVCDNVRTISKTSVRYVGRVDDFTLKKVKTKLSLLLGLN